MSEIITKEKLLPVVALRGLVVFPGMFIHFDVARPKSVKAVEEAMKGSREIFLVAQTDIDIEDPGADDLYKVGVVAAISQTMRVSNRKDSPIRVTVEGVRRARLCELITKGKFLTGIVEDIDENLSTAGNEDDYISALVRHTKNLLEDYCALQPQFPREVAHDLFKEKVPGRLADAIAGNILMEYDDRQKILEKIDCVERLEEMCLVLSRENLLLDIENEINDKVQERMDESQREYFLREQMRAISEELDGTPESEADEFRMKLAALDINDEVRERLTKACRRLEKYSPNSPEAAVERNYIDTCLSLPWNVYSEDFLMLDAVRTTLDGDHYGMEDIKERIIELLAVRKLNPDITGQIICLVGPPGVGKTSIAQSIAKAMGREYVRISLGGIKDEAEIRGHRKTYIGSMPGRIMDAIQKAGTANPLILLDEIDKLSSDYKGDPTSALLEVLDPEQNNSFRDHYLELPFDLSKVLFVTTANLRENIPAPLQDRMEIIELGSYTHEEKFHIAKEHLIIKQIKRHGLKKSNISITDDVIHTLIDGYTREAGVRKLEQMIAAVCRKAAVKVASGTKKVSITVRNLSDYAGPVKYHREDVIFEGGTGLVNGLAWTQVGGEVLQVEAAVLDGTGKLELTGSIGDVMQESAKAAVSYIRSKCGMFNIAADFYKTKDIHIHFPDGATPKDGPSAGVTITTALVSALTGCTVRGDVAMTGEVSLLGRVLPIGGLKEKTMAAYRAGIKSIIIPKENEADLYEVDEAVKANVNFIFASSVDTVLENAFCTDGYLKTEEKASANAGEKTAVQTALTASKGKRRSIRQ